MPTLRLSPVLILLLVAPFIGELLLGSTPLHLAAAYPALLPLQIALYGSGALLAREITRRTGRGWPSLLILALAYGLIEEGLGDMTLFNPDYRAMHLLDQANLFGIGWLWWVRVLTLHVVWSIGVSVALVEALFPARAARPWLGRIGLIGCAGVFFLSAAATHVLAGEGYALSSVQLGVMLALIGILVALACRLPRARQSVAGSAPAPWCAGLFAFGVSSLFMLLYPRFTDALALPGGVLVAADVVLYVASAMTIWSWSHRSGWSTRHQIALIAGAVLTYAWYGFVLVRGSATDIAGQIVFTALAIAMMLVAARMTGAHSTRDQRGGREFLHNPTFG